jgi:hypothetical protein
MAENCSIVFSPGYKTRSFHQEHRQAGKVIFSDGGRQSHVLLFSPKKCNCTLPQDVIIKYRLSRFIRHAETHMEWQQMLFTGVAVTRRGCFLPIDQKSFPLGPGYWAGTDIDQPILEGIIGWVRRVDSLPGKRTHIVEGKPGSDDQDIFKQQFMQRVAKGEVGRRIKTPQQRKLQ